MGARLPDEERGDVRFRDLFNIDEFINFVMSKATSRTGRRVITGACFMAISAVVVYPILTRTSPAPATQGDVSTLTITVPDHVVTTADPIEIPDFPDITLGNGQRIGPPLPTHPTATTAPPPTTTVAPPTTTATTQPPDTVATQPPPLPPPPPATTTPDTGVVVPYP
jgi:hypothetical protein